MLLGPGWLQGQRQGLCSHASLQFSMGRNLWISCNWVLLTLCSVLPSMFVGYTKAGKNLQLLALEGSLGSCPKSQMKWVHCDGGVMYD